MKNFFITLVSLAAITLSMTSCLGDDVKEQKYHQLTLEDKTKVMSAITGQYSGNLLFFNSSQKKDSIATQWAMRADTTMTVIYPVSFLSHYCNSVKPEIKEALTKAPVQTLTLQGYLPVYVTEQSWESYWAAGHYEMSLIPKPQTLSFSSEGHDFELKMVTSTYLTFAGYSYAPVAQYYNKEMQGFILLESLKVDGTVYSIGIPTAISGKKM